MQRKRGHDRNYGRKEAIKFVELLGCWTAANPEGAVHLRGQAEYISLLHRLIEVNKTRLDAIGFMEVGAARAELERLGT
jgi:hypothetical protein